MLCIVIVTIIVIVLEKQIASTANAKRSEVQFEQGSRDNVDT